MIIKGGEILYSLNEIAPKSPYSADYLRVRIFHGKLKGVKIGRGWFTSLEWLSEYLANSSRERFKTVRRALPEIIPEPLTSKLAVPLGYDRGPASYQLGGDIALVGRGQNRGSSFEAPAFRPSCNGAQVSFLKKFFLVPMLSALAFLVLYTFLTSKLTPRRAPALATKPFDGIGSFIIETKIPKPRDIPELGLAFVSRAAARATSIPAKFLDTLAEARLGLSELPALTSESLNNLP